MNTPNLPQVMYLPPALIEPDPNQPRRSMDDAKLAELTQSVRSSGIVQPIIVRSWTGPKGVTHRIISGERRWRAAMAAGLQDMPALVRDDLSDSQILTIQIVENFQREGVSFRDEVAAVQRLVALHDLGHAAGLLGVSKSWISRMAGLNKLWQPVQDLIAEGLLEGADAAHDLHSLHEIEPTTAERLVKEYREPPAWRGGPPTRAYLRHQLEEARQELAEAQSLRREAEELAEKRREEAAARGPATVPGTDNDNDAEARQTPGSDLLALREARREAFDALDRRTEQLTKPLVAKLLSQLKLTHVPATEDDVARVVDSDGRERHLSIDLANDYWDLDTPKEIAAVDPAQEVLRLEIELTADELQQLLDGGADSSPILATLRRFLEECTEPAEGDRVTSTWLLERYQKWCKRGYREALSSPNDFAFGLELLGLRKKRIGGVGSVWVGIRPREA